MQYQIDPIMRENPRIMAFVAEGKAEGEDKGLQEAILDLASIRFPTLVIPQVQQAIVSSQDIEQLKKVHHQIALVSDEQEASALLAQCFPRQDQIDPSLKKDPTIRAIVAEEVRESILDFVSTRFSPHVVAHVQQTIAPSQNIEQLKRFFRQLVRASDEKEVYASLAQWFSTD